MKYLSTAATIVICTALLAFGFFYIELRNLQEAPTIAWTPYKKKEKLNDYSGFMAEHLYKQISNSNLSALSETEKPLDNDIWFWADDNGKALETFVFQESLRRYPEVAKNMLKFIIKLSPSPYIFRRMVDDALFVKYKKPSKFKIHTMLMNYHGNLNTGVINQGYRFHDSRKQDILRHGSSVLSYSYRGNPRKIELNKKIISSKIIQMDSTAQFMWMASIKEKGSKVVDINFVYEILAFKPYFEMTSEVHAYQDISDVKLSTDYEIPAKSPHRFNHFYVQQSKNRHKELTWDPASGKPALYHGYLDWYALNEYGRVGDAYAVIGIPGQSELPYEVLPVTGQRKSLKGIRLIRSYGHLKKGESKRYRERRILLAGGLYSDWPKYAPFLKRMDPDFNGVDLTISYDYGAEINGVASLYLSDQKRLSEAHEALQPIAYKPEVKKWIDDHLDAYQKYFLVKENGMYPHVFSRGLSFVILGTDALFRSTHEQKYRELMLRLAKVLWSFKTKHGIACYVSGEVMEDCSGAAVVAFVRVYLATGQVKYLHAIQHILNSFSIDKSRRVGYHIYVRKEKGTENGVYWVFKAALMLRAINAAELLILRNDLYLSPQSIKRLQGIRSELVKYIILCTKKRGSRKEVLTSHRSGETNSETQPWTLLGLIPVDAYVVNNYPLFK
jgi:hypothetical protein